MKITLTQEERLKLLFEAFCGAGHIHYGDVRILTDREGYDTAKLTLKERFGEDVMVCREDVWLETFNQGYLVKIQDLETGESYQIKSENLANLDNLPHNIIVKILDDDGDYDADDLDWVLEFIMFNDKIYG